MHLIQEVLRKCFISSEKKDDNKYYIMMPDFIDKQDK